MIGVNRICFLGCEDDLYCCDFEVYFLCGVVRRN